MNLNTFIKQVFKKSDLEFNADHIHKEIYLLAKELLSDSEMQEAEGLSIAVRRGGKGRKQAIVILQKMIRCKQKRPVYYITEEFLPQFPKHTRDIIRYLGDFVDYMVKFVVKENSRKLSYRDKSLGQNIPVLRRKEVLSSELLDQLERYNRHIYVPAKHKFEDIDRLHLFNPLDVVYTLFITVKLRDMLMSNSVAARDYVEGRTLI